MLSRPNNWTFYLDEIQQHSRDGKSALSSGIKELELEGYVSKEHIRNKRGRFTHWEYFVYETPQSVKNVENNKQESKTGLSVVGDDNLEPQKLGITSKNGFSKSGESVTNSTDLITRKNDNNNEVVVMTANSNSKLGRTRAREEGNLASKKTTTEEIKAIFKENGYQLNNKQHKEIIELLSDLNAEEVVEISDTLKNRQDLGLIRNPIALLNTDPNSVIATILNNQFYVKNDETTRGDKPADADRYNHLRDEENPCLFAGEVAKALSVGAFDPPGRKPNP